MQTEIEVSDCCGSNLEQESDICSKCKEHCQAISEDEFFEPEYINLKLFNYD